MDEPFIQIKNLSKSFGHQAKFYALKNIHLNIPAGCIYGIIGMSGAGKSTLLRCLTGLEKPSTGSILLNGAPLDVGQPCDLITWRQHMGMVFQHFQLFSSRTVWGNLAYPLEIRGVSVTEQQERIEELLTLVGLTEKRHHYPSQLSGGEKQRVGIARALAHSPKILLCDEATSALDPKTTRSILHLLQELNRKFGLTIIFITHQLEAAKQVCQRIAVLSQGQVIEAGLAADLFSKPHHPITKELLLEEAELNWKEAP